MRSPITLLSLTAVLALASGVSAVQLSAQPIDGGDRRVEAARFALQASNGFTAVVDAHDGRVYLDLTRTSKHRRELAEYLTSGEVSTQGIAADFGELGSIDLAFHPTGVAKSMFPPAGCDGYSVEGLTGAFTGTISFRGEGGYVHLDASGAEGMTGASTRWHCKSAAASSSLEARPVVRTPTSSEQEEDAEAREFGHLIAFSPGRRFFRAVGGPDANGRFGPGFFVAAAFEHLASMTISRETVLEDLRQDFKFDERLRSATVRPAAPFEGTAHFRRGNDGPTHWSGALEVDLPGLENVSLIGPDFQSQLSHDLPGD